MPFSLHFVLIKDIFLFTIFMFKLPIKLMIENLQKDFICNIMPFN